MSEPVVDASVVLAILKNEAIDQSAYDIVRSGVMSSVNVAEVYSKLAPLGLHFTPSVDKLLASLQRVEAFTLAQARAAGMLRGPTSHAGLSLGDRACLALALELGSAVYTVDRNWLRVEVGCPIHLLR